jgi:hypothetical protein
MNKDFEAERSLARGISYGSDERKAISIRCTVSNGWASSLAHIKVACRTLAQLDRSYSSLGPGL